MKETKGVMGEDERKELPLIELDCAVIVSGRL